MLKTSNIIILVLIGIIIFSNMCKKGIIQKPIIITTVDTTYINKTNTIVKKVPIYSTTENTDTLIVADTSSLEALRTQFNDLKDKYTAKNNYKDTLKIDSVGNVFISDSIWLNKLNSRTISYNIKYPTITTTTIIKEPYIAKRQVFVGGTVINSVLGVDGGLGMLYKDRNDRIFGVGVNSQNGTLAYSVSLFWKDRKSVV